MPPGSTRAFSLLTESCAFAFNWYSTTTSISEREIFQMTRQLTQLLQSPGELLQDSPRPWRSSYLRQGFSARAKQIWLGGSNKQPVRPRASHPSQLQPASLRQPIE